MCGAPGDGANNPACHHQTFFRIALSLALALALALACIPCAANTGYDRRGRVHAVAQSGRQAGRHAAPSLPQLHLPASRADAAAWAAAASGRCLKSTDTPARVGSSPSPPPPPAAGWRSEASAAIARRQGQPHATRERVRAARAQKCGQRESPRQTATSSRANARARAAGRPRARPSHGLRHAATGDERLGTCRRWRAGARTARGVCHLPPPHTPTHINARCAPFLPIKPIKLARGLHVHKCWVATASRRPSQRACPALSTRAEGRVSLPCAARARRAPLSPRGGACASCVSSWRACPPWLWRRRLLVGRPRPPCSC